MSNEDRQLIREANEMHCTQWYDVDGLIERAESTQAKDILKAIRRRYFHREEYMAGTL